MVRGEKERRQKRREGKNDRKTSFDKADVNKRPGVRNQNLGLEIIRKTRHDTGKVKKKH